MWWSVIRIADARGLIVPLPAVPEFLLGGSKLCLNSPDVCICISDFVRDSCFVGITWPAVVEVICRVITFLYGCLQFIGELLITRALLLARIYYGITAISP